jgi:tetratricopeptide (TPR) repeat protein
MKRHPRGRAIVLFLILAGLFAGNAYPQAGRGVGRIGGVVLDVTGVPIEGAKVQIEFSGDASVKYDCLSNKKGEWSILGLGTGNWYLTATANGYVPENKTIYVSQLSVNPKVTIRLQKIPKGSGIVADEATFALLENGNQLYKDGKYDEAIAAFQSFFEKNPALYQIQASIADCYREKGEFETAVELYNKVIVQAATDATLGKEMTAKAMAGIGNCFLKQNTLAEAQDYFRKSIENSPKDEILAYNVGEIYFSNSNMDEALRYFELSSQIKPDWPDPYLRLGYVYLNKGDYPKAVEKLEKFLTFEPEGNRAELARNIIKTVKK